MQFSSEVWLYYLIVKPTCTLQHSILLSHFCKYWSAKMCLGVKTSGVHVRIWSGHLLAVAAKVYSAKLHSARWRRWVWGGNATTPRCTTVTQDKVLKYVVEEDCANICHGGAVFKNLESSRCWHLDQSEPSPPATKNVKHQPSKPYGYSLYSRARFTLICALTSYPALWVFVLYI